MKFEFEIECKLDTANKGEFLSKVKKNAIKLAGKALDIAVMATNAVEKAIDNAADALIEAEIALDDETAENAFEVDSEEDSEDEDSEGESDEEEKLKEYTLWEYLDKVCDYEVDSSSKTIDCKKEVEKFLKSIDFEANDATLKAFEIAIMLKKITYETVIEKVSEYFPGLTADDIKELLVDDFVQWLVYDRHDVDDNCRCANFMLLVRYFVKKVRAS